MIKHILKDGTKKDSVSGHIVKKEELPIIYTILRKEKE